MAEGRRYPMNYCIRAGWRRGAVVVPSSKSMAHRLLIAAALSENPCHLVCRGISKDIDATITCLSSLGSHIERTGEEELKITPCRQPPNAICHLPCGESGSTLRFLLPIAAACGCTAVFHMADGLAKRPTEVLIAVMEAHGVQVEKGSSELRIKGQLCPGAYTIPGSISSQYISGLLFALPLLNGDSSLQITGAVASHDYITMTEAVLKASGIRFEAQGARYNIPGRQAYQLNGKTTIEADWSNAAFFLCMGALSKKGVTVNGLSLTSAQGDREILQILRRFGAEIEANETSVTVRRGVLRGQSIDASAIPDLVPSISALAACAEGTTEIVNAGRLRYKESDRLATTAAMLSALGADIAVVRDGLVIHGKPQLTGGTVDAANDHRIAMAAAVAACSCQREVCVLGSECVEKSYPAFWKHLEGLEVLS